MAFEIILENVSPELEEQREINRKKKQIDNQIKALNQQKRRVGSGYSSVPITPTSKAFQPKKKQRKNSQSSSTSNSSVNSSASSSASSSTSTPVSFANTAKLSIPKFLSITHEDPLKDDLPDSAPQTPKITKRVIDLNADDDMDDEENDVVQDDSYSDYEYDDEDKD